MSNSLWFHGLQHSRLPCPLPTPGACSNLCWASLWWYPTISSSVISFSSCLQSFPASGSDDWVIFYCIYVSEWVRVAQSCPTLCDPMDCSRPGSPVHHQLLELAQTHVHPVGGTIQPSHPLSSPSSPTFNLFQNQGLFQWVSSSHKVAKVLEFQLQHQSFLWIFSTDFL